MNDDHVRKTADWEPGTLDKTRKNIGEISDTDAATMAKKLGGEILYERSFSASSAANSGNSSKAGRIMRQSGSGSSGSGANSGSNANTAAMLAAKRRKREELPSISKKTAAIIDKMMMSPEYKIKPNYGMFNFIRTLQKNGTEKIIPGFYEYDLKQMMEHMEKFITVIKTLIQIAPSTYKAKIANGTDIKFKFLRTVAGWSMQTIKLEYINLDSYSEPLIVADLIPFVRAVYKPLITVYYYGNNKIPKLIKEIYSDEAAYPECPKEKLSNFAKQAITEWLYIDTEIIKKLYPLLMRMCSDSFDYYPSFFNSKAGEILKFVGLHKFDLLLPEKPKEPAPKENKPKVTPPQKGIKDETVITGLKLLNQMFPEAGFDNLDNHPDLFPYFQPLFKFKDGFNLLAPDNPVQVIVVLQHIIEDCFHGCHNIKFVETDSSKKGTDNIISIIDEWAAYREDTFEFLYCEPLCDLVNSTYSQPDFVKSHIGKRMITDLLWQVTYHFMPNFKFEKLILEHPVDESKYRPLFHRTDYARKYLTVLINEVDRQAKTRGKCNLIENPWEHYNFDIPNEISKRLDVLLGAQNRTANTKATNANLLKYTLCFIAVLDWFINNPDSPAYSTDPMHIWRVSDTDGKPLFSVPLRTDQNKLFADAIRASYKKSAK
ncbi:hypothetical protein [Treponema sp. Marseille-Q3903]|uniref:hypothetical protein n=1 Tax=Treponema sp. Marseille-Q3903 TaxID=2766703 RepID=UPI0016521F63|nr:hypothetical protein [Treponema sp. Marseille-Q3903]MBC6713240.1 hypothetical protein [Treponema sp. Marseille-Q3903]